MSTALSQHRSLRLLITGGGTGGHLFPAVATAEQLVRSSENSEVLFVGTKRRLDRDTLEKSGFSVATISSYGLKGKNPVELIKALMILPVSLLQAGLQVLRFRPDVVLGVGGYVTGPVVAAAWLLRKPTVIHEQNSVPGLANRKLGALVKKICLSLPQSEHYFPAGKTVLTGNPVRKSIVALENDGITGQQKKTLVVLGGSQGAHAVNTLVVDALETNRERFSGMRVIHQTGHADEQMVKQAYGKLGIEHDVAPFFSDMADLYRQADILVSRAGATTLAEIGVVGKPAILIPYPFAADNHQVKNGGYYVESGAAVMFEQDGIDPVRLGEEILAITGDDARYQTMAKAMKALGRTDAARRIVEICIELSER